MKGMLTGRRAHIAKSVSNARLSQEDAVAATAKASEKFGRVGSTIDMPNGDKIVPSVNFGESQPVFVVKASGEVRMARATLAKTEPFDLKHPLFQLYVMSRMRARSEITSALRELKASSADLDGAALAAERFGFEETGHSADLYKDAIGPPHTIEEDVTTSDERFRNSVIMRYRLQAWPAFDFVVRRAPMGYAWGRGFLRAAEVTTPPLGNVADLTPWRFVESEVSVRFAGRKSEDAWSDWEDFSYLIPTKHGLVRRYLLQFDWNLLQAVFPLGE
jgi:hypothetical protein